MATGSSDASLAADTSDAIVSLVAGDEPVTVLATPAVRQVLAAAALASVLDAPHVRVIGPDRPPVAQPTGPVIAATTGLGDADVTLSPYTPLADLEPVLEAASLPTQLTWAIDAVRRAGADPAPGVVATHAELEDALAWSIRISRLHGARPPVDGAVGELTEDDGRMLASWLAATVAGDRPPAAAAAVETALAPTYLDDGPIPTAEGVVDVVSTATEADPGCVLASLLSGDLSPIISAYEAAVADIDDELPDLPAGVEGEVAVADAEGIPPLAAVRRWAADHLVADYGVLIAGEEPASLALAAPGDRSASAVLETVTSRAGGASWGGPFLAGAILPTRPTDPMTTITHAL